MQFIDLIVLSLAVWEVIEIWHHSSLFSNWRAKIELYDNWFCRLLTCPFCLSVWASVLFVLLFVHSIWIVTYILAVARLANLLNDMTYNFCRTPKENKSIPEDSKNTYESEHDRERNV